MLISYSWLQDFIKEPLPEPAELADALTRHIFEVESVEKVGTAYPGVVVGLVKSVDPHPNADRLQICQVDTGEGEPRQIVCGAKNVAAGQLVPVARPGCVLPGGTEIKVTDLRSVESQGMICSAGELGQSQEADGIWVLDGEYHPGVLFDEAMGEPVDSVLDIDVLPNRAHDCLSHRGVASEVAAIFNLTFLDPEDSLKTVSKPAHLAVNIDDPELARRYLGAVVTGLSARESPDWLKRRLLAVGQRPINAIVDVTNYVMYSLGQPLHAFDAAGLKQDDSGRFSIQVRTAKSGEKMTVIGGQEYPLPADATVIADGANGSRPVALAGLKGGAETNVTSETTNIVLEAATFDPVRTRTTSQKLKLATDSSKRFENDPSAVLAEKGLATALQVLLGVAGTDETEVKEVVDIYPTPEQSVPIEVSPADINSLLGVEVTADEMAEILRRLRFSVEVNGDQLKVTPPLERRDVWLTADVAEEVGRLYGYDQVPAQPLPEPPEPARVNKHIYWTHRIRDILVNQGYSEVITYALRPDGEYEIENPLTQDKRFFRSNLRQALKETSQDNLRFADLLGLSEVKIFEIGAVYENGREEVRLGLAAATTKRSSAKPEEWLDRAIAELSRELGVTVKSGTGDDGVFEVALDSLLENCPVPDNYQDLLELPGDFQYRPISPYPCVLRDVAVWTPPEVTVEAVTEVIRQTAGELLVNLYLFDTYERGDATSYAFRLVFQASDRTLSDEEVNTYSDAVYQALNAQDGWETR